MSLDADTIVERGDRGSDVVALQKRLAELGHYRGTIDGVFGGGTELAVMDFQTDAGIQIDGRAGPDTRAKLSKWTVGKTAEAKKKGRADVVYKNQHATRNRPCTAYLEVTLATAVFDTYGAGFQAQIYSGSP